ncbi:vWA domain-containing protein [Halosimplex amylolyticum]|uniref:vWA domain-containing protein n=1 Tax=Halosimplex amylolyticum TaxID=3396616 RepID=UPI003F54851D
MGTIETTGRGQSGIIGMVILIGLVLTGAMLVLVSGSSAISELQQDRSDTSSQVVMEGVDSKLATLTSSEYSARDRFSLGDLERNDARLIRSGFLNVTVNRNATCATNITLSSIRYENDEGQVVAYEAGGVWSANDNGSAMQTAPAVRFRNGSLDVSVTNLTGEVSNDKNQAFYNASTSTRESTARSQQVITGTCARPDNVTLEVQSDFYVAWGDYLEGELGVETDVYASNRTAVAYLNQSDLPRRVDDSRNHVINMSEAPYMDEVEIDGNTIRVTKNVSNDYSTYVEALSKNRVDIGQIRRIENAQNVSGPPLDVVFVLDESGSMGQHLPNGNTKLFAAQEAIKNFSTQLNASKDRVGLVGYSTKWDKPSWASDHAWIWRTPTPPDTNGRYLVRPSSAFNTTVEATEDRGGTAGSVGLDKANIVQHLKSNQTRQSVIVFLSDGEFNEKGMSGVGDNEAAEKRAETSGEQQATVYTIGFGQSTSDFNESVLQYIAGETGGEYYYASNQDELSDVFVDIATRISSTRQIARMPTSTSLQTGTGRTYAPQIAGDTDRIAVNTSGGTRYLNINDPTAPTLFSHSFALADNESLTFNASTYNCAEWRGTGITRSHNGSSYQVTRCTNMTTEDQPLGADNATIFRDGDNMTSFLAGDAPAWWQEDIEEAIDSRSDVHLNTTSNITHMKSNQALVILDYPDGTNSTNRLALLYQVGLAESEARPEGVINIRVNNVEVKS